MALVYGLCDPVSWELRYVGKTERTLKERLRGHLAPSALKAHTHKNAWLKKIGRPDAFVIEETENAVDAEMFWIAYFRALGCRLVNDTDGGDGLINPTASVREKMSLRRQGSTLSAEHKQNIALALMGKQRPLEVRASIAAGHRGKRKSSAHRAAIAAGVKAAWAAKKEAR